MATESEDVEAMRKEALQNLGRRGVTANTEEDERVRHLLETYGHAFIHVYYDHDSVRVLRAVVDPSRIFKDGRRMA